MLNFVLTSLVRDWLFSSEELRDEVAALALKLVPVSATGVLNLRGKAFIQMAMFDITLLVVAFCAPVM